MNNSSPKHCQTVPGIEGPDRTAEDDVISLSDVLDWREDDGGDGLIGADDSLPGASIESFDRECCMVLVEFPASFVFGIESVNDTEISTMSTDLDFNDKSTDSSGDSPSSVVVAATIEEPEEEEEESFRRRSDLTSFEIEFT